MKSLPFGKLGNFNLRGRLSARYADDTIRNLKPREITKLLDYEARNAALDNHD